MVIPSKYKPLFQQLQIEISGSDGWIPIPIDSIDVNPSAALVTAIGGDISGTILFTNYDGEEDPGNDKKPRIFPNTYLMFEGYQNIKNLWFRNFGSQPASVSIIFYTT